ncbi:MAG TPA: ATP-binding protein [Burkholderiaceae bacterium]|nr:ATP-binding protein [Burkholderiaceae bacterium]
MTRESSDEYFRRVEMVALHTTNMVVVTNRQREIEWVNPAYTTVTGWTLEEVRGKNPRAFLHGPRTSGEDSERLRCLLESGQAVKDFEILNYKKSGEPYWVSLSIEATRDALGEITEYVAIQTDVTERKRRELETAQLLQRLGEAQRIAKLGYVEHDLATGTLHCSAEIDRLVEGRCSSNHTSYEDLLARTHPDDVELVRRHYDQAVNEGAPYDLEHRIVSRSGRVKWVHVAGELDGWHDGMPAVFRLVVQDVTLRKEAQQLTREKELLEQTSHAQVEVLARISHDLRTPLHAIHGFAEMIERQDAGRLSERSGAHLRHIRDSARHLLALINDILDLTSLRQRRLAFRIEPVDLMGTVREVVALLEPLTAARGVNVEVVEPASPVAALADRQRLVQVLVNLIGNAIKYNRMGGNVAVRVRRRGERQVVAEVQDDGIGIAAEHLRRLFEPFYRVPGAEGTGAEGSGLGLAIAKTLAQGMRGDITVDSAVDRGSTFALTLPPARTAEVAANECRHTSPPARAPGCGAILYIEDSDVNCLLVEGYLCARPGTKLICRSSGVEGLEAARTLHPDLILVDMHLPDMNGTEVMRRVLADPELRRTPCIAFSADASEAAVEAAIVAGFREYLHKPIETADFLATIDRLLEAQALATRF